MQSAETILACLLNGCKALLKREAITMTRDQASKAHSSQEQSTTTTPLIQSGHAEYQSHNLSLDDAEIGSNDASRNNTFRGRILLFVVAFLYGSLNVSLRFVYSLPGPPSASALSTARGWLAAAWFDSVFSS